MVNAPALYTHRPNESDSITPWDIHKMIKQGLVRSGLAFSFAGKALQTYRINTAIHHEKPEDPIFSGIGASLYRKGSLGERIAARFLIPKKFRKEKLSPEELEGLRASGALHSRLGATAMVSVNGANIIGNLFALGLCMTNGSCSTADAVVMSGEIGNASLFLPFQFMTAKASGHFMRANKLAGTNEIEAAVSEQKMGWKFGLLARKFAYAAFGFKIIGGLIKATREIVRAKRNPEKADVSALIDGAVDAGDGTAQVILNSHFIHEFGKLKEARTLKIIERAGDILIANARPIPLKILLPRICFGVGGGIFSLVPSTALFYKARKDASISPDVREKMMISGGLGMLSSMASIVGAVLITPAFAFLGNLFFVAAMTILVSQTLWEW